MKKGLLVLAVVAFVVGLALPALAQVDGKAVFQAQKCDMCHAVKAAGVEKTGKMVAPDLSGLVGEKGVDWTKKYLSKEVDLNGKKHAKGFTGKPEELDAMLKFLAATKKAG